MAADLTDGWGSWRARAVLTVVIDGDCFGFDADVDGTADACVSTADISASNGVIHRVDRGFVPTP